MNETDPLSRGEFKMFLEVFKEHDLKDNARFADISKRQWDMTKILIGGLSGIGITLFGIAVKLVFF